jgi:multisubunit Na+/H+ antiporter MnhE subunit
MLRKTLAAVILLLRFLRAVVVSGVQTLRVIIVSGRPGGPPPPVALLRVRFAPMSADGAALLGCMVSLTPGTTTLDIDMERRELLLHVLDASDPAGIVRGIRTQFEPSLIVLFGEPGA